VPRPDTAHTPGGKGARYEMRHLGCATYREKNVKRDSFTQERRVIAFIPKKVIRTDTFLLRIINYMSGTLCIRYPIYQVPYISRTLYIRHPIYQVPYISGTLYIRYPIYQGPFLSGTLYIRYPIYQVYVPYISRTLYIRYSIYQVPYISGTLYIRYPIFVPGRYINDLDYS
jgi:hypothetical protein